MLLQLKVTAQYFQAFNILNLVYSSEYHISFLKKIDSKPEDMLFPVQYLEYRKKNPLHVTMTAIEQPLTH